MNKLLNPISLCIVALIVYLGLLVIAYNMGVQGGKDYMISHYLVLGI